MKQQTIIAKYLNRIVPHGDNNILSVLDTELRMFIGKTDNVDIAKCSHNAILERERDKEGKDPEHYCRKCGLFLNEDGIGRVNDFLLLRHKKCRGPICLDCVKKGGDVFYRAFKNGVDAREKFHQLLRNLEDTNNKLEEYLNIKKDGRNCNKKHNKTNKKITQKTC